MSRLRTSALTLLFVAAIAQAIKPSGYFGGRSGQVLVTGEAPLGTFSVLDTAKSALSADSVVSYSQIANYFSHVLGLLPFSSNAESHFSYPAGSTWHNTKAAIVVSVVGADADDMSAVAELSSRSVHVRSETMPASAISSLATAFTGRTPVETGIVAENWLNDDGKVVEAYSQDGRSLHGNVADLLTQTYDGRSLVISVSSSRVAAEAAGISPRTADTNPTFLRHFTVSLEKRGFVSDANALTFPRAQILARDPFDLTSEEDVAFLGELAYLETLATRMGGDSELRRHMADDAPDFIAITLYSLEGLRTRYGVTSRKYLSAVQMLDAVIARAVPELVALYKGDATASILTTGAAATLDLTSPMMQSIATAVAPNLRVKGSFEKMLPYVYLSEFADVPELCESLEALTKGTELTVRCPGVRKRSWIWPQFPAINPSNVTYKYPCNTQTGQYCCYLDNPSNATCCGSAAVGWRNCTCDVTTGNYCGPLRYNDSYSGIYQAIVWGSVIMILIFLCSALALFNIHIPRDSILYAEVLHGGSKGD